MRSDYIGLRVARWRDLAGMTQQQLADAVGVSREYISMIENGKRAVTKRDLLLKLAHAIGVDVNDLTAQPFTPGSREELALYLAAPRIRVALDGSDEPINLRPLDELVADTEAAMVARMACDYPTLGALLPPLIAESNEQVRAADDDGSRQTALSLVVKSCVTGSLAVKPNGFVDLGIRLAERATGAAAKLGDPVHLAAAQFALSQAILASGSRKRSLALATEAADAIQVHVNTPEGKTWYGMLHLHAALVSASLGTADDAASHLAEAEETAAYSGGNPWLMEFSPANVGVWRVAVALENGEPQRAPEIARRVDTSQLRTVQRRAHLLINTARGQFTGGKYDAAVKTLLAADDLAPAEVRSRPSVREIVGQMVRDSRTRGGSEDLRTLAARVRIDPLNPEA
jgi:transcriptional regulator with XRE-family HTH domain